MMFGSIPVFSTISNVAVYLAAGAGLLHLEVLLVRVKIEYLTIPKLMRGLKLFLSQRLVMSRVMPLI